MKKTSNWKMEVQHLNVGNGDASILCVYNGSSIEKIYLIDGGPGGQAALVEGVKAIIGNTSKKVDGIILTHDDKDHIAGVTTFFENKDCKELLDETLFYEQGVNRKANKADRQKLSKFFNSNPKLFNNRKIIGSFASDTRQKAGSDASRNAPGNDDFHFFSLGKEFLWNWASFALPGMYKEDEYGNFTKPHVTLNDKKISIKAGNSDYFRTKAKKFDLVRLNFVGEAINLFIDELGNLKDRDKNDPPTVLDNLVTILLSLSIDKLKLIVETGGESNFAALKAIVELLRDEIFKKGGAGRKEVKDINNRKNDIINGLADKLGAKKDPGAVKSKISEIVKINTSIADKPALLCIAVNEINVESPLYIVNDGDTPQNHRSIGCILVSSTDEIVHYLAGDLTDLEEVEIAKWLKKEGYKGQKRVPFMKFSHHGARGSTPKELLEALKPVNAIASASSAKYLHPSMELIYYIKFFNEVIFNTQKIKVHATNYPQYLSYLNYMKDNGSSALKITAPEKEILWHNTTAKFKDTLIKHMLKDLNELIDNSPYKDKDCEKELLDQFKNLSSETEQQKLLKEFGEKQILLIKNNLSQVSQYSHKNANKVLDLIVNQKKDTKKRKIEELILNEEDVTKKKKKLEEEEGYKERLKSIDSSKLLGLDKITLDIEVVMRAKEYKGKLKEYISNKFNDCQKVWESIGGFPNDQNYYRNEMIVDAYQGWAGYNLYSYSTSKKIQKVDLDEVKKILSDDFDIKDKEVVNYVPLLLKYINKNDKEDVCIVGYKEYKEGADLHLQSSPGLKTLAADRIPSENYPDYFGGSKELSCINSYQVETKLYDEIKKLTVYPKAKYSLVKFINTIYDEAKTKEEEKSLVEVRDTKDKLIAVDRIIPNFIEKIEIEEEEENDAVPDIHFTNPVQGDIVRLGISNSKNVHYKLNPYSPLAAFIGQTPNRRIHLEIINFSLQQQTVTLSAHLQGNARPWLALAQVFATRFDIVIKQGKENLWSLESCLISSNFYTQKLIKNTEWIGLKGEILRPGNLVFTLDSTSLKNNIISNAQFLGCLDTKAPLVNIVKQLLNNALELPFELKKTQIVLYPGAQSKLQTKLISDFGTIKLNDGLSFNKVTFGFSKEFFSSNSTSANAWNSVFFDSVMKIGNFDVAITASVSSKGLGNFSVAPSANMTLGALIEALLPGSENTLKDIEKLIKINLVKSIDVTFDLAQKKILSLKVNAGITLENTSFECGFVLPNLAMWAQLEPDNKIYINDFAKKFWQSELDFLPQVTVDELGAFIYPKTSEFTFHSKISSGEFKIAGIEFKIESCLLDIAKTTQKVSGNISADVVINKTSIYLSADFTDKIKFEGGLSNLKLSGLLKDLVDLKLPPELPDIEFVALNFSATPSDKKFSISGNVNFIWKINGKDWKCNAGLVISKEENKEFTVEISVSSQSEFSLIDEFVFKSGKIDFIFDRKSTTNNWRVDGSLTTLVFNKNCQMTVTYDESPGKRKLSFNGNFGNQQQTLIDFGVASILGTHCLLEIEKTGSTITGLFKITGGINITGLGTTSGFLKLYKEDVKQGLLLELDVVKILVVPASYKIVPEDIFLKLKEPKLKVEKSGPSSGWQIDSSVKVSLDGIPSYLTQLKAEGLNIKFIPDEMNIELHLSKNKFEIEGAFNSYIDIDLPNVKMGNAIIELSKFGKSRLALKKIKATIGGKPSITATVGFALPSRLNHVLFGEKQGTPSDPAFKLFKVFNQANGGSGTCDVEVGLGYVNSKSASPQVIIKLLANSLPFENFITPQGNKWKIDMGDFGVLLVDPFVFSSNGTQLTASFGYEIVKQPRLPLTPLKELLKRSKLNQAANLLPDSLPLTEFELFDPKTQKLKTEEFKKVLEALSHETGINFSSFVGLIDDIGKEATKLPNDFKDYLNFKLPKKAVLSLSLKADAGINLEVILGKDDELKVLFPTLAPLPALQGIKLKGFSFGTLLGGSLLSLQMNMVFDQFDLLTIVLGLALPYDENNPDTNVIPRLSAVQKRLIIEDLWMLIIYHAGMPIPVPIFYKRVALQYLGIEGIQMQANAEFKKPDEDFVKLVQIFDRLRKFATETNYRLSQNISDLDGIDLRITLSNIYIKTPKYLSSKIIGKEGIILNESLITTSAKVLDGFKFLDLKDLVKLIPEDKRIGDYDIVFGPLNIKGTWWITTLKEFKSIPNRRVDIDPAQIQNYLPAKNPYYKDDNRVERIDWQKTDKDGAIIWLKSKVSIDKVGHLDVAFGVVCIDAQGLFTGLRLDGKLGPFELKTGGALSIQKNQNQIQLVVHAISSLSVANLSIFNSKLLVMIDRNAFAVKGYFNLFKDLPLQLKGDMTGTIDSKGLKYTSTFDCNLGVLNLASVKVKLYAHKEEQVNGFWFETKLFNQDLNFNVEVVATNVYIEVKAGQWVTGSIHKVNNQLITNLSIALEPLCSLTLTATAGLDRIDSTAIAQLKLLGGMVTARGTVIAKQGTFEYKDGRVDFIPAGLPVTFNISNLNGLLSNKQFNFSGQLNANVRIGLGLYLDISANGKAYVSNYGASIVIGCTFKLDMYFPVIGLKNVYNSSIQVEFKVTRLTNNRTCFIATWKLKIWPFSGELNRVVIYTDSWGGVDVKLFQTGLTPLPEYPSDMSLASDHMLDNVKTITLYPAKNARLVTKKPKGFLLAQDVMIIPLPEYILYALHDEHDLETKINDKAFFERILKSSVLYEIEPLENHDKIVIKHNAHTAGFYSIILNSLLPGLEAGSARQYLLSRFSNMALEFFLKKDKLHLNLQSEEYPACLFDIEKEFSFFDEMRILSLASEGWAFDLAFRAFNVGWIIILDIARFENPQDPDMLMKLTAIDREDPERGYILSNKEWFLSPELVTVDDKNTLCFTKDRARAVILIPVFEKDKMYFQRHSSQGGGVLTLNTNGQFFNFHPLQSQNQVPFFQRFSLSPVNEFTAGFGAIWKQLYDTEVQNNNQEKPLTLREYTQLFMFSNNNFDENSKLNARIKKTEAHLNIDTTQRGFHFGAFLVKLNGANLAFFDSEKRDKEGTPHWAEIIYDKGDLSVTFTQWDKNWGFSLTIKHYKFKNNL